MSSSSETTVATATRSCCRTVLVEVDLCARHDVGRGRCGVLAGRDVDFHRLRGKLRRRDRRVLLCIGIVTAAIRDPDRDFVEVSSSVVAWSVGEGKRFPGRQLEHLSRVIDCEQVAVRLSELYSIGEHRIVVHVEDVVLVNGTQDTDIRVSDASLNRSTVVGDGSGRVSRSRRLVASQREVIGDAIDRSRERYAPAEVFGILEVEETLSLRIHRGLDADQTSHRWPSAPAGPADVALTISKRPSMSPVTPPPSTPVNDSPFPALSFAQSVPQPGCRPRGRQELRTVVGFR